jgi:NADH dehydrogenase
VTGAAGRLGRALLPLLRERGWTVRCLTHRHRVDGTDETVFGDLLDRKSVLRAVSDSEAVMHLAARTHARRASDYHMLNVTGTRHVVEACADLGVRRLVHVSTRAISPVGGAYSRSKAKAEELVLESRLDAVVLRLPEVFGMRSAEGVDDIVERARRGAIIPLVGRGVHELAPVHVADILPVMVNALDLEPSPEQLYTLAGHTTTQRSFADACLAHFRAGGRTVPVPVSLVAVGALAGRFLPLPIYPDQLRRLRSPKAVRSANATDLGFCPRPLVEALRLTGSSRAAGSHAP